MLLPHASQIEDVYAARGKVVKAARARRVATGGNRAERCSGQAQTGPQPVGERGTARARESVRAGKQFFAFFSRRDCASNSRILQYLTQPHLLLGHFDRLLLVTVTNRYVSYSVRKLLELGQLGELGQLLELVHSQSVTPK